MDPGGLCLREKLGGGIPSGGTWVCFYDAIDCDNGGQETNYVGGCSYVTSLTCNCETGPEPNGPCFASSEDFSRERTTPRTGDIDQRGTFYDANLARSGLKSPLEEDELRIDADDARVEKTWAVYSGKYIQFLWIKRPGENSYFGIGMEFQDEPAGTRVELNGEAEVISRHAVVLRVEDGGNDRSYFTVLATD